MRRTTFGTRGGAAATLAACIHVGMVAAVPAAPSNKAPVPVPLPPAPPQARPAEDLPPAYEPQLDRLAELMGTLAFLRDLCGNGDGREWRERMSALLDAEARTEARRARLAGFFNRGFRGYQATYRTCTPAAQLVIARFLDEGGRLARDLSARFGGG